MTKRLRRLVGIPKDLLDRLASLGLLTCKDLLVLPEHTLVQKLDESSGTVRNLLDIGATAVCPKMRTALEILEDRTRSPTFLPTLLEALDAALRGGVPAGSITELVGPAGVGKTQLALTLSVIATMPREFSGFGEGSGVIYIDTEGKVNAARIMEIAKHKFPAYFDDTCTQQAESRLNQLGKSICVKRVHSSEELKLCIESLQAPIIEKNVKLLVVDSVAALARQEFSSYDIFDRQTMLAKQAGSLKQLAEMFQIPVIVANQVTTKLLEEVAQSGHVGVCGATFESMLAPALGNTWSHSVNTRLVMEGSSDLQSFLRHISIAKSPLAAQVDSCFCIEASGVEDSRAAMLTTTNNDQANLEHGIVASGHNRALVGDASSMAMNTLSVVPGDSGWQQQHAKEEARNFSSAPYMRAEIASIARGSHKPNYDLQPQEGPLQVDKSSRLRRAKEQQQMWQQEHQHEGQHQTRSLVAVDSQQTHAMTSTPHRRHGAGMTSTSTNKRARRGGM